MCAQIQIPYGNRMVDFELPDQNLAGVYAPQPVAAVDDPGAEIRRALSNPVGAPRLEQIVRPDEKVAVLVDDHTRTTPAALILPHVLQQLQAGGVRPEDITIIITHGTHRLSTKAELLQKVGEAVYNRYCVVQHRCDDESSLAFVGLTGRGTPVWINRLVVEADRRVGIGHIGPSPYAGYSGGLKLIVPGVAGLDTINANHSYVVLGFRRHGRVDLVTRQDIEEAAGLVGMDLLVDVVLSQEERIVRAFAGSPGAVFRDGLALARQVYEVACPENLDLAITSGSPYDIDLYQAVRAVEYADAVVRTGGSILLAAACPEGTGGESFYSLMAGRSKRPDDFLRDIVRRNGLVTFSVLGYTLARIKAEKNLCIVTDGIARTELESMGFRTFPSVQAGVEALLDRYGTQARAAVFPQGAATIPVEAGRQ